MCHSAFVSLVSFFFPSSGVLVETVQSNPQLLMESGGAASHRYQENSVNETSIPVPVLNWPTSQLHTESVYLLACVVYQSCCSLYLFYPFYFLMQTNFKGKFWFITA